MDIYEFRSTWAKNVNSEYILPDIDKVINNNIIIPHSIVVGPAKTKLTVYIGTKCYRIKVKERR